VTLKTVRGQHRKYLPYVFTEHGAIMAASVLNSPRAIEASVYVVRAFVKMRELLATHKEFARRLDEMEGKVDLQFKVVFDAIRALMEPPKIPRRRIGY
jgi:phage regulator Rha-like protein